MSTLPKEAVAHFHADKVMGSNAGPRSLELRNLLRRFIDVCNAIDYAHSRGILHRDIKPANVIVGKHGETLVVDWGLAKALGRSEPGSGERTLLPTSDSGSAETLPGSALGTPAYMSPEQAVGDLERLGPRSDVYSLGATLYCLLTGQPPFAGDGPAAIMRAVQQGEFRPPRSVEPNIDPALEAVCLKAMALQPKDRYATSRLLAEDIERWMADEPISAWREPFSRRARRWARRNRTAVSTTAAAVLVALGGTATVLAVQTRANGALRAANQQTLHERDLAQQRFNLARKAVDDYLTRVAENPLLKERGLDDLRRDLLEAALSYYREFLRQRSDDPSLRADAAAAQERVGDIQIELGRFSDALAAYDQALALIEPLSRGRPGDPVLAAASVRLHAGRLQALGGAGRYPEAIAAFERAKELGEPLLAAKGGTEDLPEILARTYASAAFVFRFSRTDDALKASLRAYELAKQVTNHFPGDLLAARTRLSVSDIASYLLRRKGLADEAKRLCQESIAFGRARVREHPHDVEMRVSLAKLEYVLGEIERSKGHLLDALKLIRSATDTLGALARENPLLISVRHHWAITLMDLSVLQSDLGRPTEAEESARATIDVAEALVRDVPSNSFYRILASGGYSALGKARLKTASPGESLAMLRKAVAIQETSDDANVLYNLACNLAIISTIADPRESPAGAERQRRDRDRAVASIRRAIDMGFRDVDMLKNDSDLNVLRLRPDFQLLMMDLAFPADPFAR